MSEKDKQMLPYLKLFNQYDLYSKSDILIDEKNVKQYYSKLIDKFFMIDSLYI